MFWNLHGWFGACSCGVTAGLSCSKSCGIIWCCILILLVVPLTCRCLQISLHVITPCVMRTAGNFPALVWDHEGQLAEQLELEESLSIFWYIYHFLVSCVLIEKWVTSAFCFALQLLTYDGEHTGCPSKPQPANQNLILSLLLLLPPDLCSSCS